MSKSNWFNWPFGSDGISSALSSKLAIWQWTPADADAVNAMERQPMPIHWSLNLTWLTKRIFSDNKLFAKRIAYVTKSDHISLKTLFFKYYLFKILFFSEKFAVACSTNWWQSLQRMNFFQASIHSWVYTYNSSSKPLLICIYVSFECEYVDDRSYFNWFWQCTFTSVTDIFCK